MQSAETVLGVLRERGRRGLPLEELYRQLFNPQLYLLAYGRIYANKGAMTPGASGETADGMSLGKIGRIIDALRHERYRFSPVKRVYIPKKSGQLRPLGLPPWSTGVRLWIGPGGGSSGCPRGPVTLRGCSCGAGRVFALADPLRSVRSACGVRAGVRGVPGTGLAGRGRGVPGVPGSRRGGLVPGREGARVRRRAGRSAAAILASRAGAAGAGGWRRARHRCSCGPAPS